MITNEILNKFCALCFLRGFARNRYRDNGYKMQDDFLRILKSTLRTLLSLQLCVKQKELL